MQLDSIPVKLILHVSLFQMLPPVLKLAFHLSNDSYWKVVLTKDWIYYIQKEIIRPDKKLERTEPRHASRSITDELRGSVAG